MSQENQLELDEESQQLDQLLTFLKTSRGFDFSAYKKPTLKRRIGKRMQSVQVDSYIQYLDYLEVHQEEFQNLFNTILINVTSFFRDLEAWSFISEHVIPQLLLSKSSGEPIRVWVAGCASGEEAFTIAILLSEAMGQEEFRDRVKIYATDLDEDALSFSRFATYTPRQLASVPPEYLEKYFDRSGERVTFERDLRRSLIFGRHDLLQDAPISKIDLLLCRNTLMYFNAEAQARILSRFHFAVNEGGFLFLGKAETLLSHAQLFAPLDFKSRVFAKVLSGVSKAPGHLYAGGSAENSDYASGLKATLQAAAFETSSLGQIVIDVNGRLALANARAREVFSISTHDLGRLFQELELSYKPAELRSGIAQAIGQRRDILHKSVSWKMPGGEVASFDVKISPLMGRSHEATGALVTFDDITQYKRLQLELVDFNQELETAYEEVQSTNEELQTTNEELQSTVEELETTNEEMQSANEELETMNEELQSANEELEAVNDEIRARSAALDITNAFLESVLGGVNDGVIVINEDFAVMAWNPRCENLWGLKRDETIGKHLFNLDFGLPVEQMRASFRVCLTTDQKQKVEVEAVNRRGKLMNCSVAISSLQTLPNGQRGLILLIRSDNFE